MSDQVEFSSFYNLLFAIKEGDNEKQTVLNKQLKEYASGESARGYLEELGQLYLHIGLNELYKYTSEKDIKKIGSFEKEVWEELTEKNDSALPQFLANGMIKHVKDNKIAKKISIKWDTREGEIKKHITKMARYITEGLLDVLE